MAAVVAALEALFRYSPPFSALVWGLYEAPLRAPVIALRVLGVMVGF